MSQSTLEARRVAIRQSWSDFAEHYVGIARANESKLPYRVIVPVAQFIAAGCREDWPAYIVLESGERVRVQGMSGVYEPVLCVDTGFRTVERKVG